MSPELTRLIARYSQTPTLRDAYEEHECGELSSDGLAVLVRLSGESAETILMGEVLQGAKRVTDPHTQPTSFYALHQMGDGRWQLWRSEEGVRVRGVAVGTADQVLPVMAYYRWFEGLPK